MIETHIKTWENQDRIDPNIKVYQSDQAFQISTLVEFTWIIHHDLKWSGIVWMVVVSFKLSAQFFIRKFCIIQHDRIDFVAQ